ncbi:HAMP domain-containing sensor histidine kinase [Ectobacillus panaciterrae]|uniref:HAMP domain-containing sensor histidine kinase n=1 Tax=Ectobacillus panaciterrae TaxID=363872 RepID=UPI0003F4F400|nr:HAMP domain-containing histidine kinase [Ectobacillus panaciterrae]
MKITTKINLITTAWLLCILLIINVVVFFSFMKTTVNMEEEVLFQKAHDIIQELHKKNATTLTEDTLKSYLVDHSFIRIVNPDSHVKSQVTNDNHLSDIEGKFSKKSESQLRKIREEQILIIRVPITSHNDVVGTLEMGERLTGLETRKDILLSILIACSAIAIILSLLGGRWLSNIIMRPISNMIRTMEDIEKSGVPKTITIHKQTKDELEKLATTFNRMIRRLQENSEKQKQFISDASHELKTPLTVIRSYANLIRRRGIQNEEITIEAIEAIHSEATRMQKMTEALLDLAASEKENILEVKSLDLISLCHSILQQFKDVYKREITLHYSQAPIVVKADELKIKQVIIILLDNAIKYSSDKIEVFLEKNAEYALIRVRDYGTGIPKEDVEHVFERFYRVDKARSRETGGTGLGLAIAKNIMKQHKGEIKIRSEEGKGTEVDLLLPVSYTNQ